MKTYNLFENQQGVCNDVVGDNVTAFELFDIIKKLVLAEMEQSQESCPKCMNYKPVMAAPCAVYRDGRLWYSGCPEATSFVWTGETQPNT